MFLFFAFAFMVFELPGSVSEAFHEVAYHEISQSTHFQLKSISTTSEQKNSASKRLNPIADPFFPIVLLSPSVYEERDFAYYTPIYSLIRSRDYFLLI